WLRMPNDCAAVKMGDDVIYLALSLRNVGQGISVVHGWRFYPDWEPQQEETPLAEFRRQNRDIYVPPGDIGFWQSGFLDQNDPLYPKTCKAASAHAAMTVDVLYGDYEGGQRVKTRFELLPRESSEG